MKRASEPLTCTVGITGVDAGENPHPGCAAALALRADPAFQGRIVALAYDPMINGAFMDGLFDDVALVPWPGDDERCWRRALKRIRASHGIDVLLPCLDSDVPTLSRLQDELHQAGIHTLLPREDAVKSRFKWNLPELCRRAGIATPRTAVLYDVDQIHPLAGWSYPVLVKGSLADCETAHDAEEAEWLFRHLARKWGYPVLLQERLAGVEYLLSGICPEPGCPSVLMAVKKVVTTDAGKAVAGVTVRHEPLASLGLRLLETLAWKGPFELEFLLETSTNTFHLVEINGRFPAWISFSPHVGCPVVTDALRAASGLAVPDRTPPAPGIHFVRGFHVATGIVTEARALHAAAHPAPVVREGHLSGDNKQ